MDYEGHEAHACNDDDDVRRNHLFFSWATHAHLTRRTLVKTIEAHQHWIIAITPECMSRASALAKLYQERCGNDISMMMLRDLSPTPVLLALPRDQVSLDDLIDVVPELELSREAIESPDWILISSDYPKEWKEAIEHWISTDHLMN